MQIRNFLLVFIPALFCASCTTTHTARLYPANEEATPMGVMTATFLDNGSGNGRINLTTPDGEVFTGEYSIVRGGSVGFGSIYGAVYGPNTSATYSGGSTVFSTGGKGQGSASLFGTKGTTMHCEFISDTFTGHGNGACKTSKGALFRVNF